MEDYMPINEFFKKAIIVTGCIWFLFYMCYPRYQSIPAEHSRLNTVTGSYGWRN